MPPPSLGTLVDRIRTAASHTAGPRFSLVARVLRTARSPNGSTKLVEERECPRPDRRVLAMAVSFKPHIQEGYSGDRYRESLIMRSDAPQELFDLTGPVSALAI